MVRVVTATGNPAAVAHSAREAGFDVRGLAAYRDHHWWTREQASAELTQAQREGARVLITAKDRVRWPLPLEAVGVLEVEWEWVRGEPEVVRALEGCRAAEHAARPDAEARR